VPAVFISILPKSFDVLKSRLLGRNTETESVIENRLKVGEKEIQEIEETDLFNYKLINDDLKECYEELKNYILEEYPHLKD
jgi:guanylate kinase